MFQVALDRAQVPAGEIVHVGDDPNHDILGAQNMGMHTVWMNGRNKPWPEDQQRADEEIGNLKQLPEAIARIAALNSQ